MRRGRPIRAAGWRDAGCSRRRALALMLGACPWLSRSLAAADGSAPIRLAISESLVSDVNISDARAAMVIWIKRMEADLDLVVELRPRVFDPTEEIMRRARASQFDTVALNVAEYRQIAEFLDPSQIVAENGATGPEQYLLLAKRESGIQRLADLRGRRLSVLKAPKMCLASAWLSSILEDGRLSPSDQFFGSTVTDTKASRVVLPVFFGQADACLTSKRSFDTMCELNPQVAKDLAVIANSQPLYVTFYTFHKNYHGVNRERFVRVYSDLPATAAGRQLATLFQFESLMVKDVSCLAPGLSLLDKAERLRGKPGAGSGRG